MTQELIRTDESTFIRSELDGIGGITPRARSTLEILPLDRDTITTMVNNLVTDTNEIEAEPFVTWDAATALLTGTRLVVDGANITFSTTPTEISADLTDTGVVPDVYGDASHLIAVTVDEKGRIRDAEEFELNSDNVTEGPTNLFFTDDRARSATFVAPPANSASAGIAGQWSADASFAYFCYAANTWRRCAVAAF